MDPAKKIAEMLKAKGGKSAGWANLHKKVTRKKLYEEDQMQVQYAADKVAEARLLYERQMPRRWVVFIVFLIVGGALGYYAPYITNFLAVAMYDRQSLDAIMYEFLHGIDLT